MIPQAVHRAAAAPRSAGRRSPSTSISGSLGDWSFRLYASLASDGRPRITGDSGIDLAVAEDGASREIRGKGRSGRVALRSRDENGQRVVDGFLGDRPVGLTERAWPGADEVTVTGYIGGQSVQLTQHR